jgi:2-amino-4-hydroxy-6-hydroxymethyldihydropteridine diphosphokinase
MDSRGSPLAKGATRAWVGLGANLGQPQTALRQAVHALAALPGTQVLRTSSLYRSAPVDALGPDYLNAVVEIATTLSPHALLAALQTIEQAAGRERPYRNAPRTLDLDLLLYGTQHIATPDLTVPHPRMFERAFVLRPLAELAPQHVPAQALQAVQGQAMARCQGAGWADGFRVSGGKIGKKWLYRPSNKRK